MSMHRLLKLSTQRCHDRVDHAFERFDLKTASGYRGFLQAHGHVVPQCEHHLADASIHDRFPGWMGTMRTQELFQDMDVLSLARPSEPVVPIGSGYRASDAYLIGLMYVLEGSRLGGRVLAKRVEENEDALSRSATRYLRHDGGVSWRSFLDRLAAFQFTADQTEICVNSAVETYGLFERAAAGRPEGYGATDGKPRNRDTAA